MGIFDNLKNKARDMAEKAKDQDGGPAGKAKEAMGNAGGQGQPGESGGSGGPGDPGGSGGSGGSGDPGGQPGQPGQSGGMADRVGEAVNERTGGKFSDQVNKGVDIAKQRMGEEPEHADSDKQSLVSRAPRFPSSQVPKFP